MIISPEAVLAKTFFHAKFSQLRKMHKMVNMFRYLNLNSLVRSLFLICCQLFDWLFYIFSRSSNHQFARNIGAWNWNENNLESEVSDVEFWSTFFRISQHVLMFVFNTWTVSIGCQDKSWLFCWVFFSKYITCLGRRKLIDI